MTEKKITIFEIVYLLYFAVMFGAKAAGLYEGILIYNISIVVGMLLFGLKVLMTEHTLLEYIVIALLIGMCFITYFCSGEKGILYFMTMILGMKGVSTARVEKIGLTILGIFFSVLTFLCAFGVVEDNFVFNLRWRFLFSGGIIRRYLGYPNCNVTHSTFIILMMLIVLARGYRGKKDLLLTTIFLFVLNVFVYYYDASQTGLLISVIFFVTLIVLHFRDRFGKIEGLLIQAIYPLIALCITVIPATLSDEAVAWIDQFLHRRMLFLNQRLTQTPWTLFGQRLVLTSLVDEAMDSNAYIYLLLQLGIIPCIIMTTLMVFTIYNLVQDSRKTELAIAISFCVLGLSDAFLYNSSYKNILFIFTGEYLYRWLGSVVTKLPTILNTKIQIVKMGSREIEYSENALYRWWKKIGELFDSVITNKGVIHFCVFILLGATIALVTLRVIDVHVIDADLIRYAERYNNGVGEYEWNYYQPYVEKVELIRYALSVGVLSAGLLVLTMTGFDLMKQKAKLPKEPLV